MINQVYKIRQFEEGYVAMTSVLVIGAVLTVLGVAVTLNAINEAQQSLGEEKREVILGQVDACVEDALMRLNLNGSIPASLTLPSGNCSVNIDSQVGNNWTFTVTGSGGGYQKQIQVSATRTTTVAVSSRLEI